MDATPTLLDLAKNPKTTPFDYIVVGSGAGGGPLAARLALGGKRVLVLDAGIDPDNDSAPPENPGDPPPPKPIREVYRVPGYHAASTEEKDYSWQFSVRHYSNTAQQQRDHKYSPTHDPTASGAPGGIQYPRTAALGGCTAHHAMIIVKPDSRDWNRIAESTGDQTWRAEQMQGYFGRIEKCLYYTVYHGFFRKLFGAVYDGLRRIAAFINPRYQLDWGGHGFAGWQPTSFIDPLLVAGIAWRDRTFLSVLLSVVLRLLWKRGPLAMLQQAIGRFQVVQFLDPNFGNTREVADPRLSFIPIGTDGKNRSGVREHLLRTQKQHRDRLLLKTEMHVTRVIFERGADRAPRAVGVEATEGKYLYEASPLRSTQNPGASYRFYAKREIILCGGAFNTPQMLMLSGIGPAAELRALGIDGPRDADGKEVCPIVDLPGVGRNLQDRYEVSVVSETSKEFSTLANVSFDPADKEDPARKQWEKSGSGLYATNGGALAVFVSSGHGRFKPEPDLFVFGFPAAFRGYYWKWSKQLLSRVKDAPAVSRNLWSWVILKAHTRNNAGTVRLRTTSAFDQPEIDFASFPASGGGDDLAALAAGVKWVRELNSHVGPFKTEIQPGPQRPDDSPVLNDWIRAEAWGHHACGTCRMGSDPWTDDTLAMKERFAVLDSRFRVQGVTGLRVVDASIFPEIPGYFILTPIFMAAEKAADVLVADSQEYPDELQAAEACVIRARRSVNGQQAPVGPLLPADTVGLALSGGGIRSATFCLGVLQTLAEKRRIADVDILSTVSGGGYIGGFLGRLYTRLKTGAADNSRRVQETLARLGSDEMWWLRSHANYLAGEGRSDLAANVGVIWRNLLAIHLCIGTLVVAVFAALRWTADGVFGASTTALRGVPLSPWWPLPVLITVAAVVPAWFGFWIAPKIDDPAPHPRRALIVWLALLGAGVGGLVVPGLALYAGVLIAVLLLAWLWQELARWSMATSEPSQQGVVVRNRLTRALASALFVLVVAVAWVVLDTIARGAAAKGMMLPTGVGMGLIAATLPILRQIALTFTKPRQDGAAGVVAALTAPLTAGVLGVALVAFLLFGLDVLVHTTFMRNPPLGLWLLLASLTVSLAIGRSTGFLNSSSLQSLYAARLGRAFLGASNPDRVHARIADAALGVQAAHAEDDLPFSDYHPEINGGPLHLVSVCINETVDAASGRELRMDKGLPFCLGPVGASVGRRYHALWTRPAPSEPKSARAPGEEPRTALRALSSGSDPASFHVFAERDKTQVRPQSLPLGAWMAISGAAFGTASGRTTNLFVSLLYGLFNIRIGYWWNSGVSAGNRPGRYPPTLLRRLRSVFASVFRTQSTILDEWRAHFPGPSDRFWYLSDGGHFENTGVYELLRRRVPFIICVDATQDPTYRFDSVSLLTQRARLDFGAEISWLDRSANVAGWDAVDPTDAVPAPIKCWLRPEGIGSLSNIKAQGPRAAALARIDYGGETPRVGWLLLLKSTSLEHLPLDVRSYAATNPQFPHNPTVDQFMTDEQWECYRLLGATIASSVFASRTDEDYERACKVLRSPADGVTGPAVHVLCPPADEEVTQVKSSDNALTLAARRRRTAWLWTAIALVELAIVAIPGVWMLLTSLPELVAGDTSGFLIGAVIVGLAPLLAIFTAAWGASRDMQLAEAVQ